MPALGIGVIMAVSALAWSAASRDAAPAYVGVASCAGSLCHGRPVASGLVVRQNELFTWQEPSSPTGAHSRAWTALTSRRGEAITAKLKLGPAERATECLGCHTTFVPAAQRGPRFQASDGVGCESCHGAAQPWLASHTAAGASHTANIARGMTRLDDAETSANLCLDCHYGANKPGRTVTHQMMAAGHPRLSFELDLFLALQKHHTVDSDYLKRKASNAGVKTWAVGQATAINRALTLYSDDKRAQSGVFPEFYFFDCHSCHRAISDDPAAKATALANPARPTVTGSPVFNDENMIMLAAAIRVADPSQADRFEAESRAFHAALGQDRAAAVRAAGQLAASSRQISATFARRPFSRAETFAILDNVLTGAVDRYTDYTGSVQAVMAADTLLNALVAAGQANPAAVARIRPDLDAAYASVRDPNTYKPEDFRRALQRVAVSVRGLR